MPGKGAGEELTSVGARDGREPGGEPVTIATIGLLWTDVELPDKGERARSI